MENLRGSLFMTFAMATFALEDTFIKSASRILPIGEILILFGLGGTISFIFLTLRKKETILHPKILSRPIILRMICEIIGRLCFIIAIALTPLSSASAILQATPLVVVMGAAIFFKESVGWRRWLAILLGFIGVLMILRPGFDGFEPASLFAVLGTLGFAGRDLATRAAPPELSNIQLGVYGFLILIPTGLIMVPFTGGIVLPDVESALKILAAIVFGVTAYYSLTVAMRTGEVSLVTPFRYTRLVFALIIGVIVFSEKPDLTTIIGSLIIVLSGVFSLIRSRKNNMLNPFTR
ncbi:MAG: DMT family transporter [Desulfobacterales bacterium]|nr:DMT family transporter [Desulfobacterales bacterium]